MYMRFSSEMGVCTLSLLIIGIFKVFHLPGMFFCSLETANARQFLRIRSSLTED